MTLSYCWHRFFSVYNYIYMFIACRQAVPLSTIIKHEQCQICTSLPSCSLLSRFLGCQEASKCSLKDYTCIYFRAPHASNIQATPLHSKSISRFVLHSSSLMHASGLRSFHINRLHALKRCAFWPTKSCQKQI